MSFTAKEKEPLLSEKIQNVIKRVLQEDVPINKASFNNTNDILRIKMKIFEIFLHNEDILRALHHPTYSLSESLSPDLFRYTSIFPYLQVPLDKSDVKNYLCFEVSTQGEGKLARNKLVVRIICHQEEMETDWGLPRTDLISMIIAEEIDWTLTFGGSLKKVSDGAGIFSSGYFYRDLIYEQHSANNVYQYVNK